MLLPADGPLAAKVTLTHYTCPVFLILPKPFLDHPNDPFYFLHKIQSLRVALKVLTIPLYFLSHRLLHTKL